MSIINENERKNLLYEMTNLLDEYDYSYSESALNTIIDEWACQKEELIKAFKNHENYINGKFMIAFDSDFDRQINPQKIQEFAEWIRYTIIPTMVSDLSAEVNEQRLSERCRYLPDKFYKFFIEQLPYIQTKNIDEETASMINETFPKIRANVGQKTSRVINKICTYLGYSKHSDYNKEFAKYADALNPLAIKRHTILSLNPLDYLTMSFGNSWASCHTIDKQNKRGMPNSYEGQYSSGTMSYMLDPSSMVFYTVDQSYEGTDYWTQPKINRQMFHYGEEKLVQGRLYPQDNDYATDAYAPYRNIVQNIMAKILGIPNLWTMKSGTSAANRYILSRGTHYADYCYFSACTLSRIKGSENDESFDVGAEPICIECGERHDTSSNINCCHDNSVQYCEHCGCVISHEDDEYWVGDYCYCRDCVNYCDCCHDYHVGEEFYIEEEDRYVCEGCLDRYYTCCNHCDDYINRDSSYVLYNGDVVCEDCFDRYYAYCADCGEIYHLDDLHVHDNEYYCDSCYEQLNSEEEAC